MNRFINFHVRPVGSILAALALGGVILMGAGCASVGGGRGLAAPLTPIGEARISAGQGADGAFGGISGLDRDAATGGWMVISDDRSKHGPARAYPVRLVWRAGRLVDALAGQAIVLRDPAGRPFPAAAERSAVSPETVDPESLRFDPWTGRLAWSSEGDAEAGVNPAIRFMGPDGRAAGGLPLPEGLGFDPEGGTGARPNRTLEGLSWTPDGRGLWSAMEGPLIQDGALPDAHQGALVRLTLQDRSGAVLAQKAYAVDPLADPAPGRLADSGVSEVLALDASRLLVLERAGTQAEDGDFRYRVRLYCADMSTGDDIRAVPALAGRPVAPVAKRLILDMAHHPPVDNFEGLSRGPRLRDGRPTLVLVSDNNFDPRRPTHFRAFALARSADPAGWAKTHCP